MTWLWAILGAVFGLLLLASIHAANYIFNLQWRDDNGNDEEEHF